MAGGTGVRPNPRPGKPTQPPPHIDLRELPPFVPLSYGSWHAVPRSIRSPDLSKVSDTHRRSACARARRRVKRGCCDPMPPPRVRLGVQRTAGAMETRSAFDLSLSSRAGGERRGGRGSSEEALGEAF